MWKIRLDLHYSFFLKIWKRIVMEQKRRLATIAIACKKWRLRGERREIWFRSKSSIDQLGRWQLVSFVENRQGLGICTTAFALGSTPPLPHLHFFISSLSPVFLFFVFLKFEFYAMVKPKTKLFYNTKNDIDSIYTNIRIRSNILLNKNSFWTKTIWELCINIQLLTVMTGLCCESWVSFRERSYATCRFFVYLCEFFGWVKKVLKIKIKKKRLQSAHYN